MNRKAWKDLGGFGAFILAIVGVPIVTLILVDRVEQRWQVRAAEARGPKQFLEGQAITIRTTGERSIVVDVCSGGGYEHRWRYRCRVAFGRKEYPIGVITNPTQITRTYALVDFYDFELEAR